MLVEKLLLHVLIVLAPSLIYNVFFERRTSGTSPYVIGVMQGVAALLCLLFPFYSYGLYWDLRYAPLVVALLYGGPIAGGIVMGVILFGRSWLGGDLVYLGYLTCLLASFLPLLLYKKFWTLSSKQRKVRMIWIGMWPSVVSVTVFVIYLLMTGHVGKLQEPLLDVAVIGLLQVVSIWMAALLHEAVIERNLMKQEIHRAEKLNTLGELAASFAHEVRNPLTVVKGFLQVMKPDATAQHQQYLNLVLSELGRAESIINDYLNFAKPQMQKVELLDLSTFLVDLTALMQPLALTRGIDLQHRLEPGCQLRTDRNQLQQALVNLLKNAIEATLAGGKVELRLHTREEQACIVIMDNGKGMSKEQLSRIGTLFYTTKDKGTGLGTMVSLRIVEMMGGRMAYRSEVGFGTEVTIRLPLSGTPCNK